MWPGGASRDIGSDAHAATPITKAAPIRHGKILGAASNLPRPPGVLTPLRARPPVLPTDKLRPACHPYSRLASARLSSSVSYPGVQQLRQIKPMSPGRGLGRSQGLVPVRQVGVSSGFVGRPAPDVLNFGPACMPVLVVDLPDSPRPILLIPSGKLAVAPPDLVRALPNSIFSRWRHCEPHVLTLQTSRPVGRDNARQARQQDRPEEGL